MSEETVEPKKAIKYEEGLLGCPWCGDSTQLSLEKQHGYYCIRCNACTGEGPAISFEGESRHAEVTAMIKAKQKWNIRATEEEQTATPEGQMTEQG